MKKKRILIFGLSSLVGGVETYIINLVRNIDKEKFDIDFLVQDDIIGINKERVSGYYNNIYKVVNFKRHPIRAIRMLNKIYKENRYDVIHLNISTASSILYALPSRKFSNKTKIIVHSHNGGDRNKFQHYFFRILLNRFADEYLACSKLAANWMFGKKVANSKKLVITNNAIETEKFVYNNEKRLELRRKLKINENEFVIGHVGRFNEQKNHNGIIEIFSKVLKQDNNTKLILLGVGDLKKKIEEKVRNYNIANKVLFLGTQKDIYNYYNVMDLFILPSMFEGLPIVGIEAQANGLKCFFSDAITNEIDITGNVEFISLENYNLWVEKIIDFKNIYQTSIRKNLKEEIEKMGYDLKTEILRIEKIYSGR